MRLALFLIRQGDTLACSGAQQARYLCFVTGREKSQEASMSCAKPRIVVKNTEDDAKTRTVLKNELNILKEK